MKKLTLIALVTALPVIAEERRQLEAHEHGVGELNVAIDGAAVAMEFHVPGADIVGFEYEPETERDKAKIDAAIDVLMTPLNLFVVPDEAACTVAQASVLLEDDREHGHDDHDHAEDMHAEHDHDDHKHDEDEHAEHDHEGKEGHTEFHAEYALACDNPDALTSIEFAYFDQFPNAKEVEVQIVTASGAQAYEVSREDTVLNLGNLN